jgi:Protein of unknown function (DUF3828)
MTRPGIASTTYKATFFIFWSVFFFGPAGCSIPNLEGADCNIARDTVREFYSVHVGGTMKPTTESLNEVARFLTPPLLARLRAAPETKTDYFTATDDYPRAFRVGGCRQLDHDSIRFDILLFWKDDSRSEQRRIYVTLVRTGEKWLIDNVSYEK